MASRADRWFLGTEAVRARLRAHPVRIPVAFGLYMFVFEWLVHFRVVSIEAVVVCGIGSTVGAIAFAAATKVMLRYGGSSPR